MAALASGDVTYTLQTQRKEESGNKVYVWKLAFGNGALTYPAGGVPLVKASLGCPTAIKSLKFVGSTAPSGYVAEYDVDDNKIRLMALPALDGNALADDAALGELSTSTAPAAMDLFVEVVGY